MTNVPIGQDYIAQEWFKLSENCVILYRFFSTDNLTTTLYENKYERRRLKPGAIYGSAHALSIISRATIVTVKTINSSEIKNVLPLLAIDS